MDETTYVPAPRVANWFKLLMLIVGGLLVWFLMLFYYPGPFLYEHHNGHLVRVSRHSEYVWILTDSGWAKLGP